MTVHAESGDRDLSKLLNMAKDHESMCDRLLSTTRSFEGQLRALRSEHEALKAEAQALRRCLHKSGVLQAGDIEQELQQNGDIGIDSPSAGRVASSASSNHNEARDDMVIATAGDSISDGSPPERPWSQLSGNISGESDSQISDSVQRRGRSADKSGEEIPRNRGLVERWRSRSNGCSPCSRSSSKNSREPPQRKSESPVGSPQRSRPAEDSDSRRSSPNRSGDEEDLYEISKPLLDKDAGMLEQQQAYRRVARVFRNLRSPPGSLVQTWKGPGTPLSEAVRSGRVDFARLLLQAGAEVNGRDDKGVSALHLATFDGDIDLCRVLIAARAEVDLQDCVGQTPLFFSPTRRICRLLVEQFADVSALNFKGQTALHLAGRAGLHDVLSWLAQRTCKSVVEHKDIYGATAAYYLQHGVEGVPRERTRSGKTPVSPVTTMRSLEAASKGSPPSSPHTGSFSSSQAGAGSRDELRRSTDRWRKNSSSGRSSIEHSEQGLALDSSGSLYGDTTDIVPAANHKSSGKKLQVPSGSQSARILRPDSPQKKNGLLPMSARTHKSASMLPTTGNVMRLSSGMAVPRGLTTGQYGATGKFDTRRSTPSSSSSRKAIGNGTETSAAKSSTYPSAGINGQISSLSAFAVAKNAGQTSASGPGPNGLNGSNGQTSSSTGFGGNTFPQGKVLRGRGGGRGLTAKASSKDGKKMHRPSLSGVIEAAEEEERDEEELLKANVRHKAKSATPQSQTAPNVGMLERDMARETFHEEAAAVATAMEAAAAVATAAVATAAELERASSSPGTAEHEVAESEAVQAVSNEIASAAASPMENDEGVFEDEDASPSWGHTASAMYTVSASKKHGHSLRKHKRVQSQHCSDALAKIWAGDSDDDIKEKSWPSSADADGSTADTVDDPEHRHLAIDTAVHTLSPEQATSPSPSPAPSPINLEDSF